tara:strand:- start:1387 stop:1761 length:375 start_codon:yes stop_codon:yes gene_type:complete
MYNRSNKDQLIFSKEERITHKRDIQNLFNSGKKLNLFPFDIRYYSGKMGSLNKVLISVSKKNIKSAVKRNLIKRRIKESYRLNKKQLSNSGYSIAIIYVDNKILKFKQIEDFIQKILKNISKNG